MQFQLSKKMEILILSQRFTSRIKNHYHQIFNKKFKKKKEFELPFKLNF